MGGWEVGKMGGWEDGCFNHKGKWYKGVIGFPFVNMVQY